MTETLPTKTGQTAPPADGGADDLAAARLRMRRFAHTYADLPVETSATCPTCGQVVDARFDRVGGQVVLTFRCDRCGQARVVHHDRIWTKDPRGDPRTLGGARIRPVIRRLPRTVETLCPDCAAIILGRYFVQDGAVHIEKTCPDHGYFRDCVNSDVLLYSKAAWWTFDDGPGQRFPQVTHAANCPSDCGLCDQHISSPCLAQVDLTNRCNMSCPICFANAGVSGKVFEPPFEQIRQRLETLREMRPIPCTAVQFSGGEPTIHPEFLRVISTAREMGFSHIQIATNGLKLADFEFARRCLEAGLHTLYLQFDGVGEDAYTHTRAYPGIWAKKVAVIENCRRLGLKVCLVPTIVKGVNDHRVGEVFRFAIDNIDTVSAISYQPVAFAGRIDQNELAQQRYTLGDLAHDIADASGADALAEMYPLSLVTPLSRMLEALTGKPKVCPSCHPDCAFGTYFLISPQGQAVPFPRVIDVEGMFCDMNRIAARIRRRGKVNWLDRARVLGMVKKHFRGNDALPGLTLKRFVRSIQGLLDKGVGRGEGEKLNYKTLLCAGMHFQDRHNFDVERVKRCVILYSTSAGVFPFCTYNCGPEYRSIIESAQPGDKANP